MGYSFWRVSGLEFNDEGQRGFVWLAVDKSCSISLAYDPAGKDQKINGFKRRLLGKQYIVGGCCRGKKDGGTKIRNKKWG